MVQKFTSDYLHQLWRPANDSVGEDNGQVTIVGGSALFQGAPLLSAIAASRLVDMVFLATPETDKEIATKVAIFSQTRSVIWVPREDLDAYVAKSDALLIGPGLMRFHKETSDRPSRVQPVYDEAGTETKMLTKYLLQKFSSKPWVVDGGSLQTMQPEWIPPQAVLTPNHREFEGLFNLPATLENLQVMATKYHCILVGKGPTAYITDGETTYEVNGGNAGLTKGGTGDTLAGVIVGLLAKNSPLLAAAAGTFLLKKTAEALEREVGINFNADDVAARIFPTFKSLTIL